MSHDVPAPRPKTIAVVGPGRNATPQQTGVAERVGYRVGLSGLDILTGGRDAGVMHFALKGFAAADSSGIAKGIFSGKDETGVSPYVRDLTRTNSGDARNYLIALNGDVMIALFCGTSGTLSEVALAMTLGRPVVVIGATEKGKEYLTEVREASLDANGQRHGSIHFVDLPDPAVRDAMDNAAKTAVDIAVKLLQDDSALPLLSTVAQTWKSVANEVGKPQGRSHLSM